MCVCMCVNINKWIQFNQWSYYCIKTGKHPSLVSLRQKSNPFHPNIPHNTPLISQ